MPTAVNGFKVCSRANCPARGAPQPVSSFHAAAQSPDGLNYYCRACNRVRNKALRDNYTAKAKARGAPSVQPTIAVPAQEVDLPEFEITEVLHEQVRPLLMAPPTFTPTPPPTHETPAERLEVVRLKERVKAAEARARDAEKFALSGDAIREMLGTLGAPNVTADPEWLKGAKSPKSVTGTPLLFLSDIHFDEVVSKNQVGGCNEYDREIATRSIRNTFKSGIVLLKQFMAAPKYDGIVVPLGGDLVSGNIHEELVETNERPIQQTMLALEEILIEGLGSVADEFGKVHVPCVVGNHGRMHRKPRAKNRAFESYEWAIYQRLAAYFKRDNRLTFDIPDGSDALFSVYNKRFCLTHGDQFRGGGGIGGILVPIMRGISKKQVRQAAIEDPFDVVLMGHWHQYIHLSNMVINGSIKGYDEYAYQENFAFEPPQQALFVVHPEAGVTFRMPVFCRYEGGRVKS